MTDDQGTLDDAYLEWLYGQVSAVGNRNPGRSYWHLTNALYRKEFLWFIHNDDNRVEDGKELRYEFIDQYRIDDVDDAWMWLGCSMLEMLVALSRRVAFESERSPVEWFWRFMHNLELERYTDDLWEISIAEEVEETLNRVIHRTYSPDGVGGLFPLRNARHDQRKVELWYQASAYLLEGEYVNNSPRW